MIDHYATLGVGRDASGDEVRRAYRRKVAEWHPDRHGNSPESQRRFRAVQEAYEVLRDPARRARHDLGGPDRESRRAAHVDGEAMLRSYVSLVNHDIRWALARGVVSALSAVTLVVAVGGVWAWMLLAAATWTSVLGGRSWLRLVLESPLVQRHLEGRRR